MIYGKLEKRSKVQDVERNHFSAFLLISRMIPDPNIINFLHLDGQFFFHRGSDMRIAPQSRMYRIEASDDLVSLYTNSDEKVELPVITPLFEKFTDDFLEISRVKPSFRSQLLSRSPFKKNEPLITIIHLKPYIESLNYTVTASNIIECPIPETIPVQKLDEKAPDYVRNRGTIYPAMEYSIASGITTAGPTLGKIARGAAETIKD
jgi:hypothetical protein